MTTCKTINIYSGIYFVLAMVLPAAGVTRNVEPGQSIQAAIDAAGTGDRIEVAPGTCNEAINFNGKAVRLYSSGGAAVTTINGTGHYHVVQFMSGEGPDSVLEGFTITGGNARLDVSNQTGGGIYCFSSSPRIISCIIAGNQAAWGGGLAFGFYYPAVINCEIRGNTADLGGAYSLGIPKQR